MATGSLRAVGTARSGCGRRLPAGVSTFRGHSACVFAVAFSRDSRRIVSGSGDGVAKVWDVESGMEIFPLKQQHGPIWLAAFSHNDRRIVTGSDGLSATIWDATTGEEQMTLNGHTAQILCGRIFPGRLSDSHG